MRILMMTNTYAPIIGGLEKSIMSFAREFRRGGHQVKIAAPEYSGMPKNEEDVIRIPAIQKFSGTDFSVNLPIPGLFAHFMKTFNPDIIHSHHPFLMGDIALRLSRQYHVPIIFTHHIMFEHYIDYLPIHSEVFKHFVIDLTAGYANLVDHVIVPSKSVQDILKQRGVKSPVDIIPTGVDIIKFREGDGIRFRRKYKIPPKAFVVGYMGRLTPEKNLVFLAGALAKFLKQTENAYCLIAGKGPLEGEIKNIFSAQGVSDRLSLAGILENRELVDCYHAMDVFAFSSHSESQGIVLLEAMAAGIPVIAVDASAVNEIVTDYKNGRLVASDNKDSFALALKWVQGLPKKRLWELNKNAVKTARDFSMEICAKRMLEVYRKVKITKNYPEKERSLWHSFMDRLRTEIDLLKNFVEAGGAAVKETRIATKL